MLLSAPMGELMALQEPGLSAKQQKRNWFSMATVTRVYNLYIGLDAQQTGLLGKEELLRFNGGTLTPAFVDRLFEEVTTFKGKLDFRGFIDFILARENPKSEQVFCVAVLLCLCACVFVCLRVCVVENRMINCCHLCRL